MTTSADNPLHKWRGGTTKWWWSDTSVRFLATGYWLLATVLFFLVEGASALPLYTAREGRTCDNCHTLPNTWKNPEQIKDRKCTMSCSICHIDPGGAGLLKVSGRFYGQSTLPGLLASHRGYKDSVRFLVPALKELETKRFERSQYDQSWNVLEEIRIEAIQSKARLVDAEASLQRAQQDLSLASERATKAAATLAAIQAEYPDWISEDPEELIDPAEANAYNAWLQRYSLGRSEYEAAQSALLQQKNNGLDAESILQNSEDSYEEARQRYTAQREIFLANQEKLDEAEDRLFAPTWGTPLGKASKMDFVEGRFGSLRADPLVAAGAELRFASWTVEDGTQMFPMQLDAQVALQPIQHFTGYVNVGALSKVQGFDTSDAHPIAAKDAFVMYHELPYNAYVKAGRFLPQFGVRQEDHTAPNRRDFELDHGILESRGFGVEAGFNANYPYASVSLFRPGPRDEFFRSDIKVPTFGVDGIGAAFNVGYRELGWQLGASLLTRDRETIDGGDTRSVNVQWGFNPWFYHDKIPLTYLGEYSIGTLERPSSGAKTAQMASFHELNYTPFNGINIKAKVDLSEPDVQVRDDHQLRYSFGGELTVLPGVKLSVMGRVAVLPADITIYGKDLFLQLRLWL